jgi:hypothetical protein
LLLQLQSCDGKVLALQTQVTDLTHVIAVKEREIAAHVQNVSSLQEKNCQLNNEVGMFRYSISCYFFIGLHRTSLLA